MVPLYLVGLFVWRISSPWSPIQINVYTNMLQITILILITQYDYLQADDYPIWYLMVFNHLVAFSGILNVITPTDLNGTMYIRMNRKAKFLKEKSWMVQKNPTWKSWFKHHQIQAKLQNHRQPIEVFINFERQLLTFVYIMNVLPSV